MLNNLKEIQSYINSEFYCNHLGKIATIPYHQHIDIENYSSIKSYIAEHGFMVINCKGKQLLSIIRLLQNVFGKQLKDVGIKKKFVAKVAPSKNGKYYINSILSQPLHTDEGYRCEFPRFVSLYCIRPSLTGGVSTLVKTNEVLASLYNLFGNDVNSFFQANFLQLDTAYEKINKQILFHLNETSVGMSYSPILKNVTTTEVGHKMISAINQFIHNPLNQYRIKLKEYDLLIMDNCQLLHGRTAFAENENRLMLRLWNKSLTV